MDNSTPLDGLCWQAKLFWFSYLVLMVGATWGIAVIIKGLI